MRHRPLCRLALLAVALLAADEMTALRARAAGVDTGALEDLFGEPVTTSATGKPQRVADVPVAMEIITADQIARSGAHDIPGVLARLTTLDVVQWGADQYTVSARAYPAVFDPRMLILVDGRQVYLDDFGRTDWSTIPVQLAEIRQIEVVRGPNSALFGFNAAAGVINIITFDPLTHPLRSATVRLGSDGYHELSTVASAATADTAVRLSAGATGERQFGGLNPAIDSQQTGVSQEQFAADVRTRVGDIAEVGLTASYSRSAMAQFVPSGYYTADRTSVWSVGANGQIDTRLGVVALSITHNGLDYDSPPYKLWQEGVTTVQLSDTMKLGAQHTLRPSLEVRDNSLAESAGLVSMPPPGFGGAAYGIPRMGYRVFAVGGMWNWAMTDDLESTVALRRDTMWMDAANLARPGIPASVADLNGRSVGTLAYNAGIVWRATDADTFRLSAARGFTAPSQLEMGAEIYFAPNTAVVPNPALRPSAVDDYEVGYARRFEELHARLEVSGYYEINHDLNAALNSIPLIGPPAVPYVLIQSADVGTSAVSGVEVAMSGRVTDAWKWDVKYRSAIVGGDDLRPAVIDYGTITPRHLVVAHLGWTRDKWEIDGYGRYQSSAQGLRLLSTGPAMLAVNDYATVAARIGYHVTPRVTVALEGENMVQARQRQSVGLEADRRVFVSLRVDF